MWRLVGAVAVALAASACFTDRGGGSGSADESTGTGSEGGTTSASGTSGGVGSSAGSTGVSDTESGPSEPTGESSGSGSTGGIADECWDMDPTQWTVEPFGTSELTGESPGGFAISGDGLSLLYATTVDGTTGIFIVSREARGDAFSGGAPLADWTQDATGLTDPRFATGALVSLLHDDVISTSRLSAGLWWPPEQVRFSAPPTAFTGGAYFFNDDLGMFLEILDGPTVGPGPTLISYETKRDDASEPFGEFVPVRMPGWADDTPLLCPLPSPDGRHLLYGGAHPAVWSDPEDTLSSALDLWHSERSDSGAWADPTEIDLLSNDVIETCPTSITDDGCTLVISHFELGAGPVGYALATR